MPDVSTYRDWVAKFGGSATCANILDAAESSARLFTRCRGLLVDLKFEGLAVGVFGSIGRFEALEASDVDLNVFFDSAKCSPEKALEARTTVFQTIKAGGLEDVSDKTFKDPMDYRRLLKDVGGENDINLHLTYRALVLTEAGWLYDLAEGKRYREQIFNTYQEGLTTRGRYLTSLSNDLQRYYRTLCVDYRFKVAEAGKGWAIRNMKLRHSRKLWHLSNLALQCVAAKSGSDENNDGILAEHLDDPPLLKIAFALDQMGAAALVKDVWSTYDTFLGLIRQPKFRAELDAAKYEMKMECAEFRALHDSAQTFDGIADKVVTQLLDHNRDYLVRFGLL